MPHKGGKKAPSKEDDLEHELEPIREPSERDVITSPISSASSYSSTSSSSLSSGPSIASTAGSSVSSEQLERILAATSRTMADSMAAAMESSSAASKSMEASMMSLIASLTPAGSVAPAPSISARSQVKVPKWTDDEIPFEFFTKLEKALAHNGVDKSSWGQLLPVYLAGKAQAALAQVPVASLDDYESVKSVLLESLGDTPTSADRKWWSLSRQPSEDACAFYLRVRAIGIRRLQGLSTKEEILEKLVLSRFMSLLPSDSYSCAMARQPKDGLEAARIVQELEETRAYSRKRHGWRQDHHSHSGRRSNPSSGGSSGAGVRESSGGSSDGQFGNVVSDPGCHGAASGWNNFSENAPQQDVVSGSVQNPDGHRYQERRSRRPAGRPVTCHGCGEPGHIRPNCPNIIRRVRVPGEGLGETVDALLVGRPVRASVDTGSGRTLVHSDFVPRACYTGRSIGLGDWQGSRFSRHRTANIVIQVGNVKRLVEVAVVDSLECPAVLGMDLGADMTVQLTGIVFAKAKAAQAVSVNDEVSMHDDVVDQVRVTRAQAKKAAAEERENDPASVQSDCLPVALGDVFDFQDSYFEPDEVCDVSVDPVQDSGEWPELDSVELPLPVSGCDGLKLGEERKATVGCDHFVVPMQLGEVIVDFEEACVAPVDELSDIFNFSDEFFVEDQAVEVASGPVDSKSVELSDAFNFSDSFFEADPVFASVSEVKPEPAKAFVVVTAAKEGSMSSDSCWQSSSALVDSDQRFLHCYAKATRKIAPDCVAFIDFLLCLSLRFLLFVLFFLEFSMCMSKFLVLQFVGDFGPRAVLLLHRPGGALPLTFSSILLLPITGIGGCVFSSPEFRPGSQHVNADALSRMFLDDPLSRMPDAPTAYEDQFYLSTSGMPEAPTSPETFGQAEGGEMLWSPPLSSSAALLNI